MSNNKKILIGCLSAVALCVFMICIAGIGAFVFGVSKAKDFAEGMQYYQQAAQTMASEIEKSNELYAFEEPEEYAFDQEAFERMVVLRLKLYEELAGSEAYQTIKQIFSAAQSQQQQQGGFGAVIKIFGAVKEGGKLMTRLAESFFDDLNETGMSYAEYRYHSDAMVAYVMREMQRQESDLPKVYLQHAEVLTALDTEMQSQQRQNPNFQPGGIVLHSMDVLAEAKLEQTQALGQALINHEEDAPALMETFYIDYFMEMMAVNMPVNNPGFAPQQNSATVDLSDEDISE
ncbi:hypothetical protein JXA32_00650 [Candidatus Sumerlaeota bacterium]|nr:hypothetical protein [Candidatus Sumerlaeota bacterium]